MQFEETEADDLIGIASQQLDEEKVIVSSDKDMLHLVGKGVSVWSPYRNFLYTVDNFKSVVGLTPNQYLEMSALTGDSGDNITGVAKGFGETTAKELLLKYGSMEKLLQDSIAKKVKQMGNRHALLYSDGAKERFYRNLLLMDLKICRHHERTEIRECIEAKVQSRNEINKLLLRKYFYDNKFNSLLADFPRWLLPFQSLRTQ